MSINSAQANGSAEASPAAPTVVSPAPPSWPWRRAALFLAGAAQLFFLPALVVLAVGAVKLWHERGLSAGEGVSR